MCLYEIWTYSECGCFFDHKVSCDPDSEDVETLPFAKTQSMHHNHALLLEDHSESSTGFTKKELSLHGLRSEEQNQSSSCGSSRRCSAHREVHKTFLEPICDDCVLRELPSTYSPNPDVSLHILRQEHSKVWDSDVKIDFLNPQEQDYNRGRRQHRRSPSVSISERTNSDSASLAPIMPISNASSDIEEADDEDSLCHRKRVDRSRSIFRRQGMDENRQSLSSPSGTSKIQLFQTEALELRRGSKQSNCGKSKKMFNIHHNGSVWAKEAINSLRGNAIWRQRGEKHNRADSEIRSGRLATSSKTADLRLRQRSTNSWRGHKPPELGEHKKSILMEDESFRLHIDADENTITQLTWQQNLRPDLGEVFQQTRYGRNGEISTTFDYGEHQHESRSYSVDRIGNRSEICDTLPAASAESLSRTFSGRSSTPNSPTKDPSERVANLSDGGNDTAKVDGNGGSEKCQDTFQTADRNRDYYNYLEGQISIPEICNRHLATSLATILERQAESANGTNPCPFLRSLVGPSASPTSNRPIIARRTSSLSLQPQSYSVRKIDSSLQKTSTDLAARSACIWPQNICTICRTTILQEVLNRVCLCKDREYSVLASQMDGTKTE